MNKVYLVWEHYSSYEGTWDILISIHEDFQDADMEAMQLQCLFLDKGIEEDRSWWVEEREVITKNVSL